MSLDQVFSELFSFLREKGYAWEPASPDRLLKYRKTPEQFAPLVRIFGVGCGFDETALIEEGMSPDLVKKVCALKPAISRVDDVFVAHSHWPAISGADGGYIYLGQESFELIRQLQQRLPAFAGRRILDFGSGAGALAMELGSSAGRVLGLEISKPAVEWSNAAARAQGRTNVQFIHASVGSAEAEKALSSTTPAGWQVMVCNPPFAIPKAGESRPHRDGGELGIEIPLMFLEVAQRHLVSGGDVFGLMTNPIVRGRPALFDRMDPQSWELIEKTCLNDHFNQALHRKEGYAELGIRRIELWFLHLKKRD